MSLQARTRGPAEGRKSSEAGGSVLCFDLDAPIEVKITRDINLVDLADWNSLVPKDDLQATHRFARTCQESGIEDAKYWYLLLYRTSVPVAFAALSLFTVSLDLLSTDPMRKLIWGLKRIRPNFLRIPVLFCGLPVSFGRSCLCFRSDVDKAPLVLRIAQEMEKIAASEGVGMLCFKEFQTHELPDMDELLNLGYFRANSLPYCTLDLEWDDFGSYLSRLRTGYRRQLLAGLKRFEELNLEVRLLDDMSPVLDQVFNLYGKVMDRAEHRLEVLNRKFFQLLNKYLRSEIRVLLVQKGDKILSCGLLLCGLETVTFLIAGIDYDWNRQTLSYVNLLQEILRHSLHRKAKQLHLGQTSYYLKRRLGARTEPLYIYMRHRNRNFNRVLQAMSPWLFPKKEFRPLKVFRQG